MSAAIDDTSPMRFFAVIAKGAAQTERDLREAHRQAIKWLREKSALSGEQLSASIWRARRLHSDSIKREHRIMTLAIDVPYLPTWTAIAELTRLAPPNRWAAVDGAPLLLQDANRLRDRGLLLMSNRREGAATIIVVKSPQPPKGRRT